MLKTCSNQAPLERWWQNEICSITLSSSILHMVRKATDYSLSSNTLVFEVCVRMIVQWEIPLHVT